VFEAPSAAHPLGLDNNGMDVLTRLMYGGRVSLLVGFVVIFLEVLIGIIIGGVSGYFGGWVDTSLMRFVDLFNSIPFYPMVLIFGSVMDTLEIEPRARIFLLMIILGLLSWTGVARIVRGQILSLRELDFMVATEATGLRTSRRIFKHLVPNVMPLLIVQATAGLGGIIITEATLGFLGLGVKYPLASWGSIINVASDSFVMTTYWFMWIPAGMLILLTVLGFNFVGDGLRDAFDPKMKR
jgi:peptide/nickel transport system permease protein